MTVHFIQLFFFHNPYKNRSSFPITPPCFTPFYRTSSPIITVPKVLPWQMKSTRILIKTPFKRRYPAAICSVLRGVNSSLCIGHFCTENAKLSKILQNVYSKRSRNGVKSGWGYYSSILRLPFFITFFQNLITSLPE